MIGEIIGRESEDSPNEVERQINCMRTFAGIMSSVYGVEVVADFSKLVAPGGVGGARTYWEGPNYRLSLQIPKEGKASYQGFIDGVGSVQGEIE